MEKVGGKWRYTSPTHVVRAFYQALLELKEEGGIGKRHQRFLDNQKTLATGMKQLGFEPVIAPEYQSPIITTFHSPKAPEYNFKRFYELLKEHSYVIYPGKVTSFDTFRIGNIGHIFPEDMQQLLNIIAAIRFW